MESSQLAVKGAQRFAKIGFAGMSVYWCVPRRPASERVQDAHKRHLPLPRFIVYWFTFHSELSWE